MNASLNEKLRTVKWGEYKLGELFKIEGTKSLDSNAITFVKEGFNFIGRTYENNGIQGKIDKRKFEPNEPFTITATVIGNYKYVKYQQEPYYCSQNINKLSPKPIFTVWNKSIAYFMVAYIQRFVSLYDGQQGGYKLPDIKNHKIKLPVKNHKIDFDFMESFIAELSAYLKVSGLDNYELSSEEKTAIDEYPNIQFSEFEVVKIFDVKNTHNILSSDIVSDSGNVPYLGAGADNNSVSSYISYNNNYLEKGNCIFIGGKTFTVTYQEQDFFSNDSHNLALYEKEIAADKLQQLYIATCLKSSLSHKYTWGDSVSNAKIQTDKIKLPTKDGSPDYDTMSTLISAVQKLVIKDVVLYSDKKIAATKEAIKNKE